MAPLHSADLWKKCLLSTVEGDPAKIVFVVGAGVSWDGKVGVWGVSEILKHVKDTHKIESSAGPPSAAYQEVLGQLKAQAGPNAVEKTIRLAVLASAKGEGAGLKATADLSACRALQADPQAWNLPAGVLALADLVAFIESQTKSNPSWKHPCVLSTNFDGLLEVALSLKGVGYKKESIAGNAFPRGIDEQVSILHLHGDWLDGPTLHEPAALKARRAGLEAALRTLLHGARVFVVGYGGWNDIIFDTAATILEHQQSDNLPEVMWAFHESEKKVHDDDENPKSPCGHVIASFSNTIAQARTTFYCGVDVHLDLPEVVKKLRGPSTAGSVLPEPGAPSPEVLELLGALIANTPEAFRQPFEDLRGVAGTRLNLVMVVKRCCDVLASTKIGPAEKGRFEEAAWDLITCMAFEIADRVAASPVPARRPELPANIQVVPVVTSLFVTMLRAHAHKVKSLKDHLVVRDKEAFARGRRDVVKTSEWLKWETGSDEGDQQFLFEKLLWKEVFRDFAEGAFEYKHECDKKHGDPNCASTDCCRKKLFGVLKTEDDDPRIVMVPQTHAKEYQDIADTFPQISFVESAGSVASTMGIDEHSLAHLIAQFIRAAQDTP